MSSWRPVIFKHCVSLSAIVAHGRIDLHDEIQFSNLSLCQDSWSSAFICLLKRTMIVEQVFKKADRQQLEKKKKKNRKQQVEISQCTTVIRMQWKETMTSWHAQWLAVSRNHLAFKRCILELYIHEMAKYSAMNCNTSRKWTLHCFGNKLKMCVYVCVCCVLCVCVCVCLCVFVKMKRECQMNVKHDKRQSQATMKRKLQNVCVHCVCTLCVYRTCVLYSVHLLVMVCMPLCPAVCWQWMAYTELVWSFFCVCADWGKHLFDALLWRAAGLCSKAYCRSVCTYYYVK